MKNIYNGKHGIAISCLLFGAVLSLSACGGTKEKLGLTKKAPDEFAVVRRAPLSMPPDYTLRPPTPGHVKMRPRPPGRGLCTVRPGSPVRFSEERLCHVCVLGHW